MPKQIHLHKDQWGLLSDCEIFASLRLQLYRPYIALLTAHSFCGDTGTRAAALQARAGTLQQPAGNLIRFQHRQPS